MSLKVFGKIFTVASGIWFISIGVRILIGFVKELRK
jgi:hypothetical protein